MEFQIANRLGRILVTQIKGGRGEMVDSLDMSGTVVVNFDRMQEQRSDVGQSCSRSVSTGRDIVCITAPFEMMWNHKFRDFLQPQASRRCVLRLGNLQESLISESSGWTAAHCGPPLVLPH